MIRPYLSCVEEGGIIPAVIGQMGSFFLSPVLAPSFLCLPFPLSLTSNHSLIDPSTQ